MNYGADDNTVVMKNPDTTDSGYLEDIYTRLRIINSKINELIRERRDIITSIQKSEEALGKQRAMEIDEFENYLRDTFASRADLEF